MRILALGGSLRAKSLNRALLEEAGALMPDGARLDMHQVAVAGALPLFDQDIVDRDGFPADAVRLKDALRAADGLLIATPEYNWGIPGFLKNAVDWASRPYGLSALLGRPVAIMGASPSPFGAVWAQADLRKVLQTIGARVVDRELPVSEADERFPGGRLEDPDLRELYAEILAELGDNVELRREALQRAA